MTNVIRIAAAVITDAAGRILLVRKRDTTTWMQPGGKIEPGELPAAIAVNGEFRQLGDDLSPESGPLSDVEMYFGSTEEMKY